MSTPSTLVLVAQTPDPDLSPRCTLHAVCRACGVVFVGPSPTTLWAEHTWSCEPVLERARAKHGTEHVDRMLAEHWADR